MALQILVLPPTLSLSWVLIPPVTFRAPVVVELDPVPFVISAVPSTSIPASLSSLKFVEVRRARML